MRQAPVRLRHAVRKELTMKNEESKFAVRAGSDRLLRLREVLTIVPVSRTTWYDGMRIGLYPSPVNLGGRRVAWWLSDVLGAIAALNFRREQAPSQNQSAKSGSLS